MATTEKRILISLTKENLKILQELCFITGENYNQVLMRGLNLLNSQKKAEL